MSKQDEKWEWLKEVPERLEGKKRLALEFLLKKSDGVQICYATKGRSKYRIRFDDGVYQGEYRFIIRQEQLTPLSVYLLCAKTGWPGFQLEWLANFAEAHMIEEMAKIKEREAQPPMKLEEIADIYHQNKNA
jgi:hypothetical protein